MFNKGKRTIKVPWLQNERKIFGAFPWNPYVISMYRDIFKDITDKYQDWKIQYGSEHVFPTVKNWKSEITLEDVEKFLNRNKQLYDIFVKGISSCDIFIADITENTPNVMVELGIAIQLKKNILVVTSQDIEKMPFDIRGIEAKKYSSKDELFELIKKEVKIYDYLKNQQFEENNYLPSKFYSSPGSRMLTNKNADKIHTKPRLSRLKNLRIKVKFKFLFSTNQKYDWFGIYLRTQGPGKYNSELILVRYTGQTRSLTWPERRNEINGRTIQNFKPGQHNTLEVSIDENEINAWVNGQLVIEDPNVLIENFGEVWIGCWDHHEFLENASKSEEKNYLEVEYKNVKILDLNTKAPSP